MTRHFVCYPSADPKRGLECAAKWKAKGYEVLMMLDKGKSEQREGIHIVECAVDPFPGYYQVVNELSRIAFANGADVATFIGCDMEPDPRYTAQGVADIYFSRFGSLPEIDGGMEGYGVMQATGDKQGESMVVPGWERLGPLRNAARVCGSPTFGRGWYNRGFRNPGGFPEGYVSFYADETLWNVAMSRSLLWLNPEVTILHKHWSFGHGARQWWHQRAQKNWDRDKAKFEEDKANRFRL